MGRGLKSGTNTLPFREFRTAVHDGRIRVRGRTDLKHDGRVIGRVEGNRVWVDNTFLKLTTYGGVQVELKEAGTLAVAGVAGAYFIVIGALIDVFGESEDDGRRSDFEASRWPSGFGGGDHALS